MFRFAFNHNARAPFAWTHRPALAAPAGLVLHVEVNFRRCAVFGDFLVIDLHFKVGDPRPDGRGKGPVSEALRQPVPDLTTLSRRNNGTFPTERVKNTILFGEDKLIPAHGSKQMPIWGPTFHEIEFDKDFGNVRLENVTSYIASLQRKQESPSKSGH